MQVKGSHTGNGAMVVPYGARLKDIIPQLQPSSLATLNNLTIYRESVAAQQKAMINESLDRLEEMTLSTQSLLEKKRHCVKMTLLWSKSLWPKHVR